MTKSKFDIEYNKWLRQLDVEVDDAIWNGIQDELDFLETWDNISAQLDKVKPKKARVIPMQFLRVIAAAAAILLLMFLPVRYIIEQVTRPDVVAEENQKVEPQGDRIQDEESSVIVEETEKSYANNAGIDVSAVIPPSKNLSTYFPGSGLAASIVSKGMGDMVSINEKMVFEKIPPRSFNVDDLLASHTDMLKNKSGEPGSFLSGSKKSSGAAFRVVELGLVYGYKNTWLLNHETFNGLDPGRMGNTLLTFHQDIGASSMVEINNRHLVGLEFFWKSEAGQDYQQYINASFVERRINLDYRKFQAFYVYPQTRIPGQLLLGGYIAKLTLAEEQQDNALFRVDENYRNLDYGLMAGYQLNVPLGNSLNLHPGFRVNYNLLNIFEGDDITPARFKKTRNLTASFNVSLSYRFSN